MAELKFLIIFAPGPAVNIAGPVPMIPPSRGKSVFWLREEVQRKVDALPSQLQSGARRRTPHIQGEEPGSGLQRHLS